MKTIYSGFAIFGPILALVVSMGVSTAFAEQTVSEKAHEAGQDMGKGSRKLGRNMKDKTCHLVKGQMQCAGEKVMHKTENAVDEIKDKAEDIKK
jgi:hypothetical protein